MKIALNEQLLIIKETVGTLGIPSWDDKYNSSVTKCNCQGIKWDCQSNKYTSTTVVVVLHVTSYVLHHKGAFKYFLGIS